MGYGDTTAWGMGYCSVGYGILQRGVWDNGYGILQRGIWDNGYGIL